MHNDLNDPALEEFFHLEAASCSPTKSLLKETLSINSGNRSTTYSNSVSNLNINDSELDEFHSFQSCQNNNHNSTNLQVYSYNQDNCGKNYKTTNINSNSFFKSDFTLQNSLNSNFNSKLDILSSGSAQQKSYTSNSVVINSESAVSKKANFINNESATINAFLTPEEVLKVWRVPFPWDKQLANLNDTIFGNKNFRKHQVLILLF